MIKVKNAKEMERIIEQIRNARAKSARTLSKEEIEKIKRQAQETVENQSEMIVSSGASVFVGSYVVE